MNAQGRHLFVLVVEHSEADAERMLDALRSAGFEPEWRRVDTEAAFVEELGAHVDVVLSAYALPGFSGLRALELLKSRYPEKPFIIVTGSAGDETAAEAIRLGASDYLLKDRLTRLGAAVRRELEQAVAAREVALRDRALAQVLQGVLICDERRLVTFANDAFTRITGYAREEILGRKGSILQGPGTDPDTVLRMRAALDAGEQYVGEILNYRKDGTAFWNEISITPICHPDGGPRHFIGLQRDVTERKLAEEAQRWKTAFLEALVDSPLDGTLVVDATGRKILQNERFNQLFQIPARIVERPRDREQLEYIAGCTGAPRQYIERVDHLYGHPEEVGRDEVVLTDGRVLDRFTSPVRSQGGEYYGRIWGFRDVTRERMREREMAEALAREKRLAQEAEIGNRAKSEFLAVISHEIRTPMNGILGFADILAHSPCLPEECRDYVETITSSGESLLRILDDILDMTRIEAGGIQIENGVFFPRDLIDDVHALLAPRAAEKTIGFDKVVEEEVPERLWGDAGRVRQTLVNLVVNAVKFTPRGSIILGARMARPSTGGAAVEFFVRDTGVGIPADKLEEIFKPFTQVDSSASRRYGGTGLGLTISRRLAELMGGSLNVTSTVGKGSEFSLTLPACVPAIEAAWERTVAEEKFDETFAVRHPVKILLVEDDAVNLKLIRAMLRKLGYDPLVATDGVEAVQTFSHEHPGCVLMDLQMPRMDGLQAAQLIREIERHDPRSERAYISALTANVVEETREKCFEVGMDSYMNKPVRRDSLAETLAMASCRSRGNDGAPVGGPVEFNGR